MIIPVQHSRTKHSRTKHSRTKHIEIRHHFIREHVRNGFCEIKFIESGKQLTNFSLNLLKR